MAHLRAVNSRTVMTATTRLTLGSILGTVSTTANVLTSTVDAAGSGISMLTRYVEDARTEQERRSIINMAKLDEQLIREASQAEALADLEVMKFRSKSTEHDKLYSAHYSKFSALLNKTE